MKVVVLTDQALAAIEALIKYCSDATEVKDFLEEPHGSHILLEAVRADYALGKPGLHSYLDYLKDNCDIDDDELPAIEKAVLDIPESELRLPEDAKQTYSIIGYYTDNDQPWIGHGVGNGVKEAVQDATKDLEAPIKVIEVVEGDVRGVLLNHEPMDPEDIDPS